MTEFLLVTPHLRSWSDKQHNELLHSNVLLEVAKAKQVEVVALMRDWESYLTKNNRKVDWLLRDSVQMNERGCQLSARVLAAYLGIQAR